LQKWPSDRNMAMIRSKIRDATGRHRVGKSVDAVVEELNPDWPPLGSLPERHG
jgi:hypothetical protein